MSSCSPQCLSPPHCATAYYGHSPRSPPYAPPQPAPPQYPPPTRSLSNSTATHDKLPSYFTELSFRSRLTCPISRPSSARLAVAAATRPTSKLRRRDLSPQFDRCHDKVPSYLSCFTNSTKYDGLTCYRDRKLTFESQESQALEKQRLHLQSLEEKHQSLKCQDDSDENMQLKLCNRRQIYIGHLRSCHTESEMSQLFSVFGKIESLKLHRREHGDNYAFIVYEDHESANAAVEVGRHNPGCETFDVSFSGRRQLLSEDYRDFDGDVQLEENLSILEDSQIEEYSFDDMLKLANKRILSQDKSISTPSLQ